MLIKVIIHTKQSLVWEGRACHIILLERQTAVVSKGDVHFSNMQIVLYLLGYLPHSFKLYILE